MEDRDTPKTYCCEQVKEVAHVDESGRKEHYWLDHKVIENLPVGIKKSKNRWELWSGR